MRELTDQLQWFITNTGPHARLEIGGELDAGNVHSLRTHLGLLVEVGTGDVDIDMAHVSLCDSSGLAVLAGATASPPHRDAASEWSTRRTGSDDYCTSPVSTSWPARTPDRSPTRIRGRAQRASIASAARNPSVDLAPRRREADDIKLNAVTRPLILIVLGGIGLLASLVGGSQFPVTDSLAALLPRRPTRRRARPSSRL